VVITFIDELEPDEAVRILKHSAQWCRATRENLHATAAAYEVSTSIARQAVDGPELLELNAWELGALPTGPTAERPLRARRCPPPAHLNRVRSIQVRPKPLSLTVLRQHRMPDAGYRVDTSTAQV